MNKNVLLLILAALLLSSCSSVPITGRKQLSLISDAEVLSSSLTQYKGYMAQATVSGNKVQSEMVTRVGKALAVATETYLKNNGMESDIRNYAWEFSLVANTEVNAFCMPGGKIVVYEGLMKMVSSEDELAVVIGHEVAHAVAKHSNERMSQQILAQYGCYWSSTSDMRFTDHAYSLFTEALGRNHTSSTRDEGFSVRPVTE